MKSKNLLKLTASIGVSLILLNGFPSLGTPSLADEELTSEDLQNTMYTNYNRNYTIYKEGVSKIKEYEGALITMSLIQTQDLDKYKLSSPDDYNDTLYKLNTMVKGKTKVADLSSALGYDYNKIVEEVKSGKSTDRRQIYIASSYDISYYYDDESDSFLARLTITFPDDTTEILNYPFDSTGSPMIPSWYKEAS